MTIDKALEILRAVTQADERDFTLDTEDAMKLGIEALKGIKKVRKIFRPYVEALLPGETEEK